MNKKKFDGMFLLGCLGVVLVGGLYAFFGAVALVFAPLFVANYFGWNYVITLVIWWLLLYAVGGRT